MHAPISLYLSIKCYIILAIVFMEIKDIIGKRLKEIREHEDLSQGDLAKEMGVTQSAIAHYEIGRNCPSHEIILWYANRFGVTTDFIYGRTDYPYSEEGAIKRDLEYNKIYLVAKQVIKDMKKEKGIEIFEDQPKVSKKGK